ncbi:hypothetical protein GALMADRAFT_152664 [Galerina marginata CBS 339.88]|uniref:F-box domain-containing protein n=1 Tax=Galerina marginata (strain CBS 339.88) TaxID=685588 RepID=A0A067THM6_GALM3|nr:hypothetical protein GALMADRAFT_152664 [Galerina marginata CBS 339.88]
MAVIRQIFEAFCAPCHRRHEKCKLPGCATPAPLILGRVCKEWREIAWKTPTLWTWIDIPVSRKRYQTQLELLEEWLERTRDQPLFINVRPEIGDHSYVYSPSPIALFELLVRHSEKWKAVHILSSGDDCTKMLNTAQERVPILETFTFSSNGQISELEDHSLDLLTDAPNLRTLDLFGFTPNLEYCKYSDYRSSGRQEQSTLSPILLPHLKSLVIKRCEDVDFLPLMEVPSLRRLSIVQSTRRIPFQSITDFIDQSRIKLHALGISTDSPIDVVSLQALLTKVDSITRLYIGSRRASDYQSLMLKIPKILNPSTPADNDKANILLPNLQVLYYCTVDPVSSPAMIDMIKHRWKGNNTGLHEEVTPGSFAKLKVVRFKKAKTMVLLDPLKQEIVDGLDVTYDLPYKGQRNMPQKVEPRYTYVSAVEGGAIVDAEGHFRFVIPVLP